MGFKNILKTVALVSVPIGVTFLDCVGYVARVEGLNLRNQFQKITNFP